MLEYVGVVFVQWGYVRWLNCVGWNYVSVGVFVCVGVCAI